MDEVRIGSWILDIAAGAATEGDRIVTVFPESDGKFTIHFSGDPSLEDRRLLEREVLELFERAKAVSAWRCCE
jgi:hypothetical protein